MADYGTIGKILPSNVQVSDIDLGYDVGTAPDVDELSSNEVISILDGPVYSIDGVEELKTLKIVLKAPPWKGEGTVVEYLYIGGGISVY